MSSVLTSSVLTSSVLTGSAFTTVDPPVARPAVVEAGIDFLAAETQSPQRPFMYSRERPDGAEPPTARFASQVVRIEDVRAGKLLGLEENGAALLRSPTRVRRFSDDAHVRERYYPESAEIIQAVLGADRVIVFDHNIRRGSALPLEAESRELSRPVPRAHTDYTPGSALRRLHLELGARAEESLSRYLQVNLWRPIRGPVRDAPLALCDGASVASQALRTVELRYPDRTGEIYYLVHEPGQRWYFASDMSVDEAWLFKNFDSAPHGSARAAPHSAFTDPRYLDASPRESIEVRALAIFG
jgi:hypothetical protein